MSLKLSAITISLEHKPSGDGWRLWPACEKSRAYTRNLGSFSLSGDPIITIEYFRNAGYNVQVKTPTLIFNYPAYEVAKTA